MSVEGFQFEPTYPPGREPPIRDEGEEVVYNSPEFVRVGNTEWCDCENCSSLPTEDECECCLELDVLNQKFDDSGLFVMLSLFKVCEKLVLNDKTFLL